MHPCSGLCSGACRQSTTAATKSLLDHRESKDATVILYFVTPSSNMIVDIQLWSNELYTSRDLVQLIFQRQHPQKGISEHVGCIALWQCSVCLILSSISLVGYEPPRSGFWSELTEPTGLPTPLHPVVQDVY
jgi:hypothetical protein